MHWDILGHRGDGGTSFFSHRSREESLVTTRLFQSGSWLSLLLPLLLSPPVHKTHSWQQQVHTTSQWAVKSLGMQEITYSLQVAGKKKWISKKMNNISSQNINLWKDDTVVPDYLRIFFKNLCSSEKNTCSFLNVLLLFCEKAVCPWQCVLVLCEQSFILQQPELWLTIIIMMSLLWDN